MSWVKHQEIITFHNLSNKQISHLVPIKLLFQLMNHSKILHRAWQLHCRALCKILAWFINWDKSNGQMRIYDVWMQGYVMKTPGPRYILPAEKAWGDMSWLIWVRLMADKPNMIMIYLLGDPALETDRVQRWATVTIIFTGKFDEIAISPYGINSYEFQVCWNFSCIIGIS